MRKLIIIFLVFASLCSAGQSIDKINGISSTSLDKRNGVSSANIDKINGITLAAESIPIDIGDAAVSTATNWGQMTLINIGNPANASGKITTVEIYSTGSTDPNITVAIFYGTGSSFSVRDYQNIGVVARGAKRTFTVDLDVQTGDYIGCYSFSSSGSAALTTSGGSGIKYVSGDVTQTGSSSFSTLSGYKISLYGYN